MIQKHWYLSGLALGVALLPGYGNLQAQSLNYGLSISSLPVQVGKPFEIKVSVPATVPDGTAFFYSAESLSSPNTYPGESGTPILGASGISINHQLAIQSPPFTTPGLYRLIVGQKPKTDVIGVDPSLALNAATTNLIVSPAGQSPNPLATFTGNYAFLFKGHTIAAPGAVSGAGVVGTFTADGNGNITSGTLDVNTAIGMNLQNAAVTGTYQLDATGKGSLRLITPGGPLSFNFFAPNVPGVLIQNASLVPAGGFTGTGEVSQTAAFFNRGFVFESPYILAPVPLNTSVGFYEESASGGGFLPGAGLLAFNQDSTVAGISQAIPGLPDFFAGLTGTYSSYYTERFTLTLSAPGQASTTPTHYVMYGGNTLPSGASPVLYFLSLDPHPATTLVVGKIKM